MTFYDDTRPHPIKGMVANPEWDLALTKRAELYIAERARREEVDHEPNRFGLAVAIIALVCVGCALIGSVV